jgi:signal peptidase I
VATLKEWGKSIAIAVVAWLILRTFLVQAFYIPSPSMENTFLVGDVLFVARPTYGIRVPLLGVRIPGIREPRHADIVIFESVEEAGLDVVKRVAGIPGDTLEMANRVLIRNGKPVEEPWAHYDRPDDPDENRRRIREWTVGRLVGRDPTGYHPDRNNWGPIVVPPDSLFVMGDNRDDSWDGRYWGFLPRRNVTGSPLIIYYSWDPQSWRPLPILTATRWNRLFTIPK